MKNYKKRTDTVWKDEQKDRNFKKIKVCMVTKREGKK